MSKWMPEPRLWDIEQAACYLGIATGTLYNLVSEGEISCVKGSGLGLKFLKEHLDEYINRNKKAVDKASLKPIAKNRKVG